MINEIENERWEAFQKKYPGSLEMYLKISQNTGVGCKITACAVLKLGWFGDNIVEEDITDYDSW